VAHLGYPPLPNLEIHYQLIHRIRQRLQIRVNEKLGARAVPEVSITAIDHCTDAVGAFGKGIDNEIADIRLVILVTLIGGDPKRDTFIRLLNEWSNERDPLPLRHWRRRIRFKRRTQGDCTDQNDTRENYRDHNINPSLSSTACCF
jgi:hypothetical protein